MSLRGNKELVLRFFDEVFNARQPQRTAEFLAPNAVMYPLNIQPLMAHDVLNQTYAMLYAAFPDCHITIQDITAERNIVVTRSTFSGTHQGKFKQLAPTGKSFSVLLIYWMRIVDDQILECWHLCEDLERVLST